MRKIQSTFASQKMEDTKRWGMWVASKRWETPDSQQGKWNLMPHLHKLNSAKNINELRSGFFFFFFCSLQIRIKSGKQYHFSLVIFLAVNPFMHAFTDFSATDLVANKGTILNLYIFIHLLPCCIKTTHLLYLYSTWLLM